MTENSLRRLWKEDKAALGAWLSIPDSFSAEVMARAGYDWLCIDMQHGLVDFQRAVPMLQAISTTTAAPVVRVPWNDPAIIMKVLDAGAQAVIVPLINTRADTELAVSACRYPPRGIRSYGPTRAGLGGGYFERAEESACCIPMIETASALKNLDDILSVPGVDAVYVGPMDLSLSLGLAPKPDREGDAVYSEALGRILEACRRHGVAAGIHAGSRMAAKRVVDGFRFVLVSSDVDLLARNAARELRAAREAAVSPAPE